MSYGISPGGGFTASFPSSGYATNQSYNPYQSQGWNPTQGGNWTQASMGYNQPTYGQHPGFPTSQ